MVESDTGLVSRAPAEVCCLVPSARKARPADGDAGLSFPFPAD